jgi:hypothetical protein
VVFPATDSDSPPEIPEPGKAQMATSVASGLPTPTPSLLVYLFADRLLPSDTIVRLGAPVPCSTAQVKMTDLSRTLLAVTFWSLRERGLIELQLVRRRRLLLGSKWGIAVQRLDVEPAFGLERAFMTLPNIDPDAYVDQDTSGLPGPLGDVSEVLSSWFAGGHEDPEWKVVETVLGEAEQVGLLKRRGEHSKSTTVVSCAAISEQRPRYDAFENAWRDFQRSERTLHAQLLHACGRGIAGARSYPEGDTIDWKWVAAWLFRSHARVTRPWPESERDAV